MTSYIKKKKEDIGLSPDDLIFRGEKKIDQVLLRIIDFDATNLTEDFVKTVREVSEFQHECRWSAQHCHNAGD